jgi:hypothetical protein
MSPRARTNASRQLSARRVPWRARPMSRRRVPNGKKVMVREQSAAGMVLGRAPGDLELSDRYSTSCQPYLLPALWIGSNGRLTVAAPAAPRSRSKDSSSVLGRPVAVGTETPSSPQAGHIRTAPEKARYLRSAAACVGSGGADARFELTRATAGRLSPTLQIVARHSSDRSRSSDCCLAVALVGLAPVERATQSSATARPCACLTPGAVASACGRSPPVPPALAGR